MWSNSKRNVRVCIIIEADAPLYTGFVVTYLNHTLYITEYRMKKSRKGRGETRAILNHLTTYRVSQITLQNCNQDKKWRVVHVQIMHQFFLYTTRTGCFKTTRLPSLFHHLFFHRRVHRFQRIDDGEAFRFNEIHEISHAFTRIL